MKIILPTRELYIVFAFALFSFLPNILLAQDCTDCNDAQRDYSVSCLSTNDNERIFDLTEIESTVDTNGLNIPSGATYKYFETCSSGAVSNEITAPENTKFQAANNKKVWWQILDGGACDTIVEIQLKVANNSYPCPTSSGTIDGCPVGGGNDGEFILETMGGTLSYFSNCSANNGLTGAITGTMGTPYVGTNGDVVYIEEEDPVTGCVTVSAKTLNVVDISVSISLDPTSGAFCSGGSVKLTANVTGGSGSITYAWDTPTSGTPTDISINGSTAGPPGYSVQATRNGCTVQSETETLVDQSIAIANTARTNVTCNGLNNGTYSVTVTGGSGQYDYMLFKDNSAFRTENNEGSSITFPMLPAGDYHVVVEDDGGAMCSVSNSTSKLEITEPPELTLMLSPQAPSMLGGGDGLIDVTVSNGTAPYDWNISGTETKSGDEGSATFDITSLDPGPYNVSVTDQNGTGCTVTGMVTVPDLVCNFSITNTNPTGPECRDDNTGSIVVTTSGKTGNFDIDWSRSEGGTGIANNNSNNSATIPGLLPGTYSITVTDDANCSATVTSVVVPNPAQITFSLSQDQAACAGVANGIIQVNSISNGTSPYIVKWNGPGSNDGELPPSSNTSPTIPGLVAGSYSITVEDANGCFPAAKTQSVSELSAVSVTIVGDDVFCFDDANGTLSTSPSNFSNYNWSTGAMGPGASSITIQNPGATNDNYTVTVTDGSGCTGSDIVSVSRLPDVTVSLNSGASKTIVTCDSDCDGRIDINKGGGTGTFTYLWNGPGGFTRTTEDIDNLCPGAYSLTITDTQGCTETFSQTISGQDPIVVSASASDATCFGDSNGSVTVSADGGTPFGGGTYQYVWSPGGANTQSISNLSAGTYTVTVTDANGCFNVESAIVRQPDQVAGLISPSNPEICNGETISLTASGGTSYMWLGGLGNTAKVDVAPTSTATYNVIVTDAATNNCTDQASITVKVNQLPVAQIGVSENSGNANNDRIICEGKPVTITASGGISYNWSGGVSNPFTVSPSAGSETYTVTVTDVNGCTDTEQVEIEINENPTAIIDFSSASQAIADVQNIKNSSIANCEDIINCSWTSDGSPVPGNNCDGITPTFNTGGSKTIKLQVENSCGCISEVSSVLEIFASDQCAVEQFTVNQGLGVACVGEELDILIGERATPNCVINERDFDVFRNGTLLTPGNEYEYDINTITFNAPGNYDMRYTIGDNCECVRPSTRNIEVVPAPSIAFMPGNPNSGCQGESLNIKFDGFDEGEKVVVQYSNGNIFTYEDDNFDLQLGAQTSETLTILSVENATCEVDIVNQSFEIGITPKFEIVSQTTKCTDDGLSYSLTIETSGGVPGASIVADGIVGTGSGSNSYIIPNLDPTQEYSFSLSKGNVCDPIQVEIPTIVCNCTFFVGENIVNGFSGCEDDVFNITLDNIFSTEGSDFDPETDTLIYVLHDQNTGLNLGKVFKIFPSSTTQLTNDFPGFVPNLTTFRLSIVGLRKATLDDFDFDNPSSLNSAGSGRCLSVVSGIPVLWFRAPAPDLGTANNTQFICRNAYDYMLFAQDILPGSSVSFRVEGLPDENIKSYGFQDTVFVHFEDNGQDSFNVIVSEFRVNFNGTETDTCLGETMVTLYVEDGPGAPPPSEIILWPGNIMASTADPNTTCFEWGFLNFGEESGVIGTDKYLYAANDINIETSGRIYFVDTYFCDSPDCVTRVFYNAAGPTPGLNYKEEEAFSYLVKPNPNRGQFVLDLFSEAKGNYSVRIIDITGKPVFDTKAEFNKGQNNKEFDLTNVPKGVYFIQIVNTSLNEYSIDKIVIN
jgi:hypothetical protein